MHWYKLAFTGRQFSRRGGKFGVIRAVDAHLNHLHARNEVALFGPAIVLPSAVEYGLYLLVPDKANFALIKGIESEFKACPCEAPPRFGLSFWWGDRKFFALML